MLPHSISFEYLWAIFPPDCFVVGMDALNNTTIWKARLGGISRQPDGSIAFVIQAENIDWDGEKLGISSQLLPIPSFSGAMAIEDLPFIPLQHHQRKDQIVPIIRERSRRKMEFVQEGFKTKQYEGYGLIKADSRHYVSVSTYWTSQRNYSNPCTVPESSHHRSQNDGSDGSQKRSCSQTRSNSCCRPSADFRIRSRIRH